MGVKEDMDSFQSKVSKALEDLVSPQNLKPIANDLAEIIRRRTRLGSGVDSSGGKKSPLKALKQSTVDSRKSKQTRGLLSDKTSPRKSNLTDTAQLLDSLQAKVVSKQIEISPVGNRKDGNLSNAQVGAYVESAGRKFLNLGLEDIKQLTAVMQDSFNSIVNKIFK